MNAYPIGTGGGRREAVLLGTSVAITHSLVVIGWPTPRSGSAARRAGTAPRVSAVIVLASGPTALVPA